MTSRKVEHLNERIRQKLSTILYREANDPRFFTVTITEVKLAKDLSFARVLYSSYGKTVDRDELTESLNRAAGFFSHTLGRSLKTRVTPKLRFDYDPGFDHAERIDEVLDQLPSSEE